MKRIAYSLIALAIAAFTFTSCEDVPSPFGIITDPDNGGGQEVVDPTGDGTAANPFNVAAAIDYVKALGADVKSDKDVYIKGVIVEVKEAFGTQYGNAQFSIADSETGKQTFVFYRGLYLGNQKYSDDKATNVKVGDNVVICGKVIYYKGSTPETSQGEAYVVSINGEGGDTPTPTPSGETLGTKENPLTIDQALEKINALADGAESDQFAFVKGKVVKVTTNQTNFDKYQNLNYLISEDGTDNGKTITVYSGDGLDGAKFTGITDLAQGDEVIVYGKLYKYVKDNKVTPEIAKGNYLVSLVKGSGGGGGGGTTGDAQVVSVADFNAAAESTDTWYQLTGTVKNLKDGDQYGNFDLEDETGSVYVYGLLSEKGGEKKKFQDLVAQYGIKNGSKITIIGNRGSFNGKIEVLNAYFVKIEDGDTPSTPDGVQAISVADFNAAAESTDVWYQLTGTISNLKDGDQYGNFDLTDSTGSVYVYGVLSEKGGAKKKFQELVTQYGIANGKTITIIGNRGSFNGKIEVVNAYFVSVE